MKTSKAIKKINKNFNDKKIFTGLFNINRPVFELRLDKNGKYNGDIYFYLIDKKNNSEIIKVDKNACLKELYPFATENDFSLFNVSDIKLSNDYKPFISIDAKSSNRTHLYYSVDKEKLLRKDRKGNIIKYLCYTKKDKNKKLPGLCNKIFDILEAEYIFTLNKLNEKEPTAYAVGFYNFNTNDYSNTYSIIEENLFNLNDVYLLNEI